MPSDAELEQYNSSYWGNAHSLSISNSFDNPWFNLLATLRHKYLHDYINLNGLSILEIGPGEGYLANRILSKHQNVAYDVVETDLNAQAFLKTLSINVFNNLSAIPANKKYDLVIASHVLEHVSQPKDFISQIQSYICKSGFIFIEVPCLDFLYKSTHDPHLLFFDKQSLDFLLSLHSLDVLKISHAGPEIDNIIENKLYNFFKNLSYRLLSKISRILDFFRFFDLFFFKNKYLGILDSSDQKLLCLYHSCHVQSSKPSRWLRVIAIKS